MLEAHAAEYAQSPVSQRLWLADEKRASVMPSAAKYLLYPTANKQEADPSLCSG
jgi:hypothetical protein